MQHRNSATAYAKACQVIPGGVNSPARAFGGVGGQPIFIAKGEGPYLIDIDGNRYLDYCGSWGPLILGHAHPRVVQAVTEVTWTAQKGNGLAPGEFGEFTLSVGTFPENMDAMSFPATQTYSDGEVVKWNQKVAPGTPESQEPDLRTASQDSSSDGKRVRWPIFWAATWSTETPARMSAPAVFLTRTPVRKQPLARAWSPGPSGPG